MAKNKNLFAALLIILAALTGCQEKKTLGAADSAMAFFQALYVDQNLNTVLNLSGPKLHRVFSYYGDTAQIQENLLALRLDKVQEISTFQHQKLNLEEFQDMVEIGIFVNGSWRGNKIADDRILRMKKLENRWVVIDIIR